MTFKDATWRMQALGFTLAEMADALGISHQYIRMMRGEPGIKSFRPPPAPEKWRPAFARMARERIKDLQQFAETVERG